MKRRNVCLYFIPLICFCLILSGCHKHQFSEATCTEPAKCVECGATEGEPLGHTTDFGICDTCGEAIGKETEETIKEAFYSIMSYMNNANANAANGYVSEYDLYNDLKHAAKELNSSKTEYDKIIDVCDKYGELEELKSLSIKTRDSIPKAPKSESISEMEKYLDDEEKYMSSFKSFSDEVIRIMGLFED